MKDAYTRRAEGEAMPGAAGASRREVLKLSALGGVVFASSLFRGLAACTSGNGDSAEAGVPVPPAGMPRGAQADFFFLQLSDTHWGFSGPKVNPDPDVELPNAIAAINALAQKPDFVIFTGDLTHNSDDGTIRRQRMSEFKQMVMTLNVPMIKFIPGEHDAGDDGGAAFKETFGDTHYSFDHKGIHFVALDNVSDPTSNLGSDQLAWLEADLAPLDSGTPIVVFAHKPLWALRNDWDWTTLDGQRALDLLMPFQNVVVFFGHIHQELEYMTGHIAHHAARSMMFNLPSPDTDAAVPTPLPWIANRPNNGLGYRSVDASTTPGDFTLTEVALPAISAADAGSDAGASPREADATAGSDATATAEAGGD